MAPYHDELRFDKKLHREALKGGVLLLLYPADDEIFFPLIRRPHYEGVHGGQMALPGGKYEPPDRDLIETSLREAHEEIGVPRTQVEVVGCLTDLFIPISNFIVSLVIGYIDERPVFIPDSAEVAEVIEANLAQLLSLDYRGEKTIQVGEKVRIEAPFFNIGNATVWGATAMILSEFAEIVKDL